MALHSVPAPGQHPVNTVIVLSSQLQRGLVSEGDIVSEKGTRIPPA